jgi:hypothetical protein
MLGESLDHVAMDGGGVVGDRRYALVDHETGKVVSVKRPKWWARMFELAARTSGDIGETRTDDHGLVGHAPEPRSPCRPRRPSSSHRQGPAGWSSSTSIRLGVRRLNDDGRASWFDLDGT